MHTVGLLLLVFLLLAGNVLGASTLQEVRLAMPAIPGLSEVPLLLAGERLRARGIDLQLLTLAQPALVIQTLLQGTADVGLLSLPSSAGAMQQGAGVKFFLTHTRNSWTLVGRGRVSGCLALTGRSIAVHSSTGLSAALVRAWLAERCPTTATQIVIIPGSENRAAALLAGRIDLAALELADAIEVERLRPTELRRIADFGQELPWLLSFIYLASGKTLGQQREVLKSFTREVLASYQLATRDPALIAMAAAKYVRAYEPDRMAVLARAYAEAGLWPTDGAFTAQALGRTLRFLEESGSVSAGLQINRIADFTILSEVLREPRR